MLKWNLVVTSAELPSELELKYCAGSARGLDYLNIVWVSHSFGYGNDLMYYGEIFRAFCEIFPKTQIVVDSRKQRYNPFLNPYSLRFRPILHQFRLPISRRNAEGQAYETEIAFPSPSLIARLAAARMDVIITIEFTLPALMAMIAARLSSKRLILLVESDPMIRGGSRNPLVLAIKRLAARLPHVIQTNNESGCRYVVEELRVNPSRVRVAPYLTSRPPGPITRIIPHDGPLRILFANSLTPRKGVAEFFDALQKLDLDIRSLLDITIVGGGEEASSLEARSADLGMGKRLRFKGSRCYAELGVFYAEADVLVIPTLADYRSLTGFEGLSYGLVLLASKYDGASVETVEEGVNGFVVDPKDPIAFASRIRELANDRALAMRMRRASFDLYQNRFSLERVASNLAESVAMTMPKC